MWSAKRADGTAAGIDQRKAQVAAVEPERREHTGDFACGVGDIDRRRMGKLIVLGVVAKVVAERGGCGVNGRLRSASEIPMPRAIGIFRRRNACARIARAVSSPSFGSRPMTTTR